VCEPACSSRRPRVYANDHTRDPSCTDVTSLLLAFVPLCPLVAAHSLPASRFGPSVLVYPSSYPIPPAIESFIPQQVYYISRSVLVVPHRPVPSPLFRPARRSDIVRALLRR